MATILLSRLCTGGHAARHTGSAAAAPDGRGARRINARRDTCQQGQGAVEFLFAAIPVLLLGLGSIEALHWHFTRQAISLALVQAARVATASHASPQALDEAFANALLPYYAGRRQSTANARLARGMAARERSTGLPAWNIRILSPSQASFSDFHSGSPDLPHQAGLPVIDNDYIHEQHERRLSQGWRDGRGPSSGQTTLEANTLVLHLTWLHEPLLPGVKQLMRQLSPADDRYGSIAMRRAGYLPLRRELAMVMQSHPIAWPMPRHGRITRNGHPQDAEPAYPLGLRGDPATSPDSPPPSSGPSTSIGPYTAPCQGLWCLSWNGYSGDRLSEDHVTLPPGGVSSGPPATGTQPGSDHAADPNNESATGSDAWMGGSKDVDQRPGEPRPGAGEPAADPVEDPGVPAELEDCPGCC